MASHPDSLPPVCMVRLCGHHSFPLAAGTTTVQVRGGATLSTTNNDCTIFWTLKMGCCSCCYRRQPTLSRRQKRNLTDNRLYVQDYVKKKKQTLYQEYLQQSVAEHDLWDSATASDLSYKVRQHDFKGHFVATVDGFADLMLSTHRAQERQHINILQMCRVFRSPLFHITHIKFPSYMLLHLSQNLIFSTWKYSAQYLFWGEEWLIYTIFVCLLIVLQENTVCGHLLDATLPTCSCGHLRGAGVWKFSVPCTCEKQKWCNNYVHSLHWMRYFGRNKNCFEGSFWLEELGAKMCQSLPREVGHFVLFSKSE